MRVVLRKLLTLVPTVVLVTVLTFLLFNLLPGDVAVLLAGNDPRADTIEAIREDLHLDDPLPVRYVDWVTGVVRGDFGRSYITNQPVSEAIRERLPVTLEIGLLAVLFALALAIPLGVWSAYRANGVADRTITTVSFGLLAVPGFMMAMLLLYVFAERLRVLPATGWVNLTENPVRNLRTAVMPALSLGIGQLAIYTRLLRTDMIATLQEDYVSMAKAKGLSTRRILFRHALRPSSFSLLTIVGVNLGALIGGAVIVEKFFAVPGLGRLLYDSIAGRDLQMVQGVVVFLALGTVLANFAVDLLYSVLDPRIRRGAAGAA